MNFSLVYLLALVFRKFQKFAFYPNSTQSLPKHYCLLSLTFHLYTHFQTSFYYIPAYSPVFPAQPYIPLSVAVFMFLHIPACLCIPLERFKANNV